MTTIRASGPAACLARIAEEQAIVKVFYPVFPPDRNAEDVLDWLSRNRAPLG